MYILNILFYSITGKHHHTKASSRTDVDKNPSVKEAFPFVFKNAAVAADHYNCSMAGKEILKKGGNAVDAIIAVHHCVEVCQLHSTGLGGGGFMVIYKKGKTARDGRFLIIPPNRYIGMLVSRK